MKYPLTDKAKDYAKKLVDEWQGGRIRQNFSLVDVTSGSGVTVREMAWGLGATCELEPDWEAIQELGEYGLVRIKHSNKPEVILLQELRNAVESDFEVSEYFLNRITVKVIVDVQQTLGEEFLAANAELRDALNALREATEADKQSKLGRVISELGRCLGHGANTATIISALRGLIG